MTVNGEIEIKWGDGEHKFNIARLKCVLELEEKCDAGIAEIFTRIQESRWRFNDIRETLRLGLIGGGATPDKALRLVNRYCDDRPWAENVLPAQAVLIAAMVGVPGDPLGDKLSKKAGAERTPDGQSTTMDAMSAPSSTESELPSDSIHAK